MDSWSRGRVVGFLPGGEVNRRRIATAHGNGKWEIGANKLKNENEGRELWAGGLKDTLRATRLDRLG